MSIFSVKTITKSAISTIITTTMPASTMIRPSIWHKTSHSQVLCPFQKIEAKFFSKLAKPSLIKTIEIQNNNMKSLLKQRATSSMATLKPQQLSKVTSSQLASLTILNRSLFRFNSLLLREFL